MDDYQQFPAHAPTAAHRRRWFQFRLKWLLVFMAVLAVPLSWLGWKLEEKRRERWAEAELQKTDAGLPQLHSLAQLDSLDLRETKVSANAVAELRKAMPHCHVLYERVD